VQIKNRQQLLTIVSIAAIGLLALDRILLPPLTSFWKERSAQIDDLRTKVREGDQLGKRERVIRERWDQMRTNTLPNNNSAAEQKVVNAFYKWEQDSRVSITSIMPQWKQDSDDYKTLECRIDASGRLDALSRFLYDIEKDPMALKLQSVELTARDNEGQQLTLALQVSALVLTPKEQSK
jgi:Tfp pilus assembly protein PilO